MTAFVYKSSAYAIMRPFFPPESDLEIPTAFVDVQFPNCVSFGSSGGPGFKTSVFEVDSGLAGFTPQWEQLRANYSITFESATPADISTILDFFYAMRGQAIGFRYKDWSDYQISQILFVGDGITQSFQLFKEYKSGGYKYNRTIKKIVDGTVTITLDDVSKSQGTDFFVDNNTGIISFATTPPINSVCVVTAEFDVPVRFAADQLSISSSDFRQSGISQLPLVEIRV